MLVGMKRTLKISLNRFAKIKKETYVKVPWMENNKNGLCLLCFFFFLKGMNFLLFSFFFFQLTPETSSVVCTFIVTSAK